MAKVTFNQTYIGKTDRQIKECIIDPKRGGISDLRKHAFKVNASLHRRTTLIVKI